jgi:hypothetical protein
VIHSRDALGRAAAKTPDTETTRYCPECDKYLPKSEFYRDERAKGGLTRRCRTHHVRKSYESRKKKYDTPAKRYAYARKEMLRKKYGLTVEQYMAMAEAQSHVCKICRQPETEKYGAVHVGHDHQTRTVRGLLCGQCNTGLGKFRDDPALLRAAIDYLERNHRLP